jgi:hypothetical protein
VARARSSVRRAVKTASESCRRSRRRASVQVLPRAVSLSRKSRPRPMPRAWVTAMMCRAVLMVRLLMAGFDGVIVLAGRAASCPVACRDFACLEHY